MLGERAGHKSLSHGPHVQFRALKYQLYKLYQSLAGRMQNHAPCQLIPQRRVSECHSHMYENQLYSERKWGL